MLIIVSGVATVNNSESYFALSACVRLFIESLMDESGPAASAPSGEPRSPELSHVKASLVGHPQYFGLDAKAIAAIGGES